MGTAAWVGFYNTVNSGLARVQKEGPFLERQAEKTVGKPALTDPSSPEQRPQWWEFYPALTVGIILSIFIMVFHYVSSMTPTIFKGRSDSGRFST
jgi:hypothetical protein